MRFAKYLTPLEQAVVKIYRGFESQGYESQGFDSQGFDTQGFGSQGLASIRFCISAATSYLARIRTWLELSWTCFAAKCISAAV